MRDGEKIIKSDFQAFFPGQGTADYSAYRAFFIPRPTQNLSRETTPVYMYASLYSLTRHEVDYIYDDVVAFSELEEFKVRIVALLATYNEECFIRSCLKNLFSQGVEVYLMDNESTDQTVAIAERYLGQGLIGIEILARNGMFSLRPQLERKEQLAVTLEADWFMHVDADEIRLPPRADCTLAQAFAEVEAQGFNAVNFMEFTFIPTQEAPDHDHPDFQKTMRWYYPFLPTFPHRLNAWKRQSGRVDLAWSGGHQVRFPGLLMYPESFRMRHYLFLSMSHAIRKFVGRRYDPAEVEGRWHGWRAQLRPEMVKLPRQAELCTYLSDDQLDPSNPRTRHYLAEQVEMV